MKILTLALPILIVLPSSNANAQSWKNFYAICWTDSPDNNIKYARAMGYDYIGIASGSVPADYGWISERRGLKFYLVEPHKNNSHVFNGYSYILPLGRAYTVAEKEFYERYMAWKSTAAFPHNLATGWWETSNQAQAIFDFQQQAVIDYVVAQILAAAHAFEARSIDFTFAGVMIDVPRLRGDMHLPNNTGWPDIDYWTGTPSSLLHSGITHQYPTFVEGQAAFLKTLKTRMKQEFPDSKLMFEPAKLYRDDWDDEWIKQIRGRADRAELVPDFLSQELGGTEFVDDARNFDSGVNITKDMVGSTQPLNDPTIAGNRTIAAKAGINGAWYNWFGRWGDISMHSIALVGQANLLIRVLPNWDNLSGVPLGRRSWVGGVYESPNSYASSEVIYSRNWKTGKLFGLFLTAGGVIRLRVGESLVSVQRTDSYFVPSGDGSSDVSLTGRDIRLNGLANINKAYIFTLSASQTDAGEASDGGSSDAGVIDGGDPVNDAGISDAGVTDGGARPPKYGARRLGRLPNSPVIIDGDLREFQNALPIELRSADSQTSGRYWLQWDDQAMYLAAEVKDTFLNAKVTQRDGALWNDDSLEMMFDTQNDRGQVELPGHDDYKFFVNIFNIQLDERGAGVRALWNSEWQSAVRASGSINDNSDSDHGYTLEVRVPWSSWGVAPPVIGTRWGLDLMLNDARSEVADSRRLAWSNTTGGTPNDPDGWGELEFMGIGTADDDGGGVGPCAGDACGMTPPRSCGCEVSEGLGILWIGQLLFLMALARRRR